MNKYQEALDYVNKSVCTALDFLGVEDKKHMNIYTFYKKQ